MRAPTFVLAFVLTALGATVIAGQPAASVVRGQVTDSSGGVLPGVTVVATLDGRILTTGVTDGSGGVVLKVPPPGRVTLTFQLEGFSSTAITVTIEEGVASRFVQRLELAQLAETVVVHAPLPPPLPAPPLPPRIIPQAPPPPVVAAVPAHDRDSICGPAKPGAATESLGTITSSRDAAPAENYAAGAQVIVDRGVNDGLQVGRNLVVRRDYVVREMTGAVSIAEHSAGLLQIVKASEHSSVAVVVYACDELRPGDFLASFKPEPVHDPEPAGTPAFRDAAKILFADEGQTLGAPRRLMVIDRGTDRGAHVGQRFTLFRQRLGSKKNDIVGEAVVVAVRSDSATIKIVRVADAITAGDFAAPQIQAVAAR